MVNNKCSQDTMPGSHNPVVVAPWLDSEETYGD